MEDGRWAGGVRLILRERGAATRPKDRVAFAAILRRTLASRVFRLRMRSFSASLPTRCSLSAVVRPRPPISFRPYD